MSPLHFGSLHGFLPDELLKHKNFKNFLNHQNKVNFLHHVNNLIDFVILDYWKNSFALCC